MKQFMTILIFLAACLGALFPAGAQNSGCLTLYTPPVETTPGATLCIPVKAREFQQIVSLQYTHKWDPAQLEWAGWLPGSLPSLFDNNFGLVAAQQDTGVVAVAWIEPSLQAVNLPDDAVLYQLCFHVLGGAGQSASLRFARHPTPPEFSDANSQLLDAFSLLGSAVNIGGGPETPLAITGGCAVSCSAGQGSLAPEIAGGLPPYTYTWTGPGNFSATSGSLSGLNPGEYTLIVADQNGHEAEAIYSAPSSGFNFTLLTNPSICGPSPTGSAQLFISQGIGPFTFEWSDGDTAQNRSNLVIGTHGVTITDNGTGCTADTSFEIGQSLYLAFNPVVSPANCAASDGSITLLFDDLLPDPQQINWNTGAATSSIANLAAGVYEATLTDTFGCFQTYEFSVAQTPDINLESTITAPGCNGTGGMIDITQPAVGAPFTYLWNTGADTEDLADLAPGAYSLTITNSFGCVGVESFNLSATALIVGTTYTCDVTSDTTIVDIGGIVWAGGTPPYTFQWSNGDVHVSDFMDYTSVAYPGVYALTVSDNSGCQEVISNIVPVCSGPSADFFTAYSYECTWDGATWNADITLNVWAGGTPPYTFLWNTGEASTHPAYSTISGPANAAYAVTVIDAQGLVYVPDAPSPNCGNTNQDEVEFYFTTPQDTVQAGEAFCVELRANNFTDIVSAQLTVQWDTAMVEWVGMEPMGLPGVNNSNFGMTADLQAQGVLPFYWISLIGVGENAYTLPDGGALFRVCLRARQDVAGLTNIGFGLSPTPVEIIAEGDFEAPYHVNVLPIVISGQVTSTTLTLAGGHVNAFANQQVCVPFTTNNFTGVNNFGFTLAWDPTALTYDHVQAFGLPDFAANNFAVNPSAGQAVVTWGQQVGVSVTLPQNAVLFEMCFMASDAPQNTLINFSSSPLEAHFEGNLGVPITHEVSSGSVNILEDGIILKIGQELAEPGQEVCVPLSVESAEEVLSMQFTIAFDTSRLDFTQLNLSNLAGLSQANFGTTNTAQGLLTFAWYEPTTLGLTVNPGQVLFEMCFQASEEVGVAPITFSSAIAIIEVIASNNEPLNLNGINGQVTISDLIVWPGDTNTDGLVNHFDLLPIGLAYAADGPERPDASIAWTPQVAYQWVNTTPASQINYAHIDADGNGAVEAADTLALAQNWGEEQQLAAPQGPPETNLLPSTTLPGTVLYVVADTLIEGETASLDIILGEASNPAMDIYGIAFSIVYDPDLVVAGSVSAAFNPSWVGQIGNNLMAISREDIDNHRIDIALTRTDGQNITGYGVAGQLQLTIEDVIFARSEEYELQLTVENVQIINNLEDLIPIEPLTTTSIINAVTGTTSLDIEKLVEVYPVPTSGLLWIQSGDLQIKEAIALSATGQTIGRWVAPGAAISLHEVPAGVYALALITEQGVVYRTIIKQ